MTFTATARDVYQQPAAFISEVFAGKTPKPQILWITRELQQDVRDILGHDLGALRIRYWRHDDTSAWILEEIGKEQLITTGIMIYNDRIERIKVLIYRESRGMEVQYPFFTDQYRGASLTSDHQLDRNIDGISGATLSVRALTKLARLALYLDQHIDVTP